MFGVPLDYLDRECIEVIELLDLNFHLGNALKYLWRFGRKSEARSIEDLKKARWYIEQYLKIGVRRVLAATEERDRLILSKIDALILKIDDQ